MKYLREDYNINTSNPAVVDVLERLAKNDRNLEVGSVSAELAYGIYTSVKESAGTETKSCISNTLGMKINGPVFDEFPFIFSAHSPTGDGVLVKILRVAEGTNQLATRIADMKYEAESSKFVHDCIVPSERRTISIDADTAQKAHCRVGENEVLIMPWYTTTLNKHPSNCLDWIALQGRRILEALKYLHNFPGGGFVHMDVKAPNIFVTHDLLCYLGDFGSCKPIGISVTSCTVQFCWLDVIGLQAHPKYDYFMFLLMILIECLEDRRTYSSLFYEPKAHFASVPKVLGVANATMALETTPPALVDLLGEVLGQLTEYGVVAEITAV